MAIKKRLHIITSICLFVGILLIGQVLGFWQLKGHEIGGDTLIMEVSKKYGIPLEAIYETWNIPEYISPKSELGKARDEVGFSIGKFRIWVTAFVENNDLLPVEALAGIERTTSDDDINITGSTTIQAVSDMFNIPIENFYKKFSLPESLPKETLLRELRENHGIEMGEIKIWIKNNRK